MQPDIMVDNSPEDVLAGRDRQLEVGVQELLKEIGTTKPKLVPKLKTGS